MTLYNFYHIFADGKWELPVTEYIAALKNSKLIEQIDLLHVGIVGSEENRKKVKDFLTPIVKFVVVAEEETGWEQVTQNKLYEFSQTHEGYVLYAHTKGSFNPEPKNQQWRREMTQFTVTNWKDSIKKLEICDATGSKLFLSSVQKYKFFAGTFWWTKLSHIKKIGPPKMNSRYDAEIWINSTNSNLCNMEITTLFFNRKVPKANIQF